MMQVKKNSATNKVMLALLAVGGILLAVYLMPGDQPSQTAPPVEEVTSRDAAIVIDNFHQTSTRDGNREWSLDADSAVLDNEGKQADFQKLAITFYLEGGDQVYLTADSGTLQMESKDMVVSGNVVVTNDSFVLKTDRLFYVDQQRTFSSKDPVHIDSGESKLAADTLVYNLATNTTEFNGSVMGTFGDAIAL